MRTNLTQGLWIIVALALMTGCDLAQLAAFRSQMRAINEFTAWGGGDRAMFVFKKPLLTLDDLAGLQLYPKVVDEHNAVLRYHRAKAPAGAVVEYEFRLLFSEGRLAGLIFPDPLRDGLGRENITGLFAMIGGGESSGMRPFPKDQLTAAGLFPKTAELGQEAVVLLIPEDDRNRPLYIKMTERKKPGYFSEFLFSVKRRPGDEN